jgi:hypothetical protein
MSKEFLDRSSWVVVELASGEERRMGAAITTREWCVDIDNRGNEYTVTVIGQTAADDRQEIVVAGGGALQGLPERQRAPAIQRSFDGGHNQVCLSVTQSSKAILHQVSNGGEWGLV